MAISGKAGKPLNIEEVCNPYNAEDSKQRTGAMVYGDWQEANYRFIDEIDARALYFNVSKGWKGTDFGFLEKLTKIEELNIIVARGENLDAIEGMSNLQSLNLTCQTKSVVDFTKLPRLEDCYLLWWPGAASIFAADALQKLYLDELRLDDFSPLQALTSLRHLIIGNSNIASAAAVGDLSQLERLELLNCRKLADFDDLSRLTSLKRLTIRGSKALTDLGFLRPLRQLEVLIVSDNGSIDSLEPVADLTGLKALAFAGSTTIADGDLGVLTALPKLSMLMFAGRRHYTHKLVKRWDWRNLDVPDKLLEVKRGTGASRTN